MTTHDLKIWPEFFADVASGKKAYEIRINDRGFQEGDVLLLREWDPKTKAYTGSEVRAKVVNITQGKTEPLYLIFPSNVCVMGIKLLGAQEPKRIFISQRYFELLAMACSDWPDEPRHFTDFGDFLNNLKMGLEHNGRSAVFGELVKEETRMLSDPRAFEI
jgi:hypothetical protein